MKLLTLNTHSLIADNYLAKRNDFVQMATEEKADIIALQEVNQTANGTEIETSDLSGYRQCTDKPIREDNHVYQIVTRLAEKGIYYYWTWLPIKMGYDRYDEGLAVLSSSPILETDVYTVSRTDDYKDWRTRKILGIRTAASPEEWFYSVHYGWWNDVKEPFAEQWEKTNSHLHKRNAVWLLGDFNNPAEVRGEGYDLVKNAGWRDSYTHAAVKDEGITVNKNIDGWNDQKTGIRIDQIWYKHEISPACSRVVCNGVNYPVVSDHFGVIVEYRKRA